MNSMVETITKNKQPLTFTYKNWRGEISTRVVEPQSIWFGKTEYHPEPQWFISAYDLAKKAPRTFAINDIQGSKFSVIDSLKDAFEGLSRL